MWLIAHRTPPHACRLRGCVVAPTKIIAGLALCLGMRLLPAPGASGDYRSDLAAKAQAMAAAMAPDQPHDVRFSGVLCFALHHHHSTALI